MKHLRQGVRAWTLLSFIAVTVLLVSGASAQSFPYKSVPNDPTNTRIYTLPNGLTVYLSINKNEPRIQTAIAVRAGSKHDPADATGLAHYLEHMLFKGTDKFGSSQFDKEQQEIAVIESLFETYRKTIDTTERKRLYRMIDSVSQIAASYAIANEYDKMLTGIGAKGTNAYTWFEQTVYINDIPSNQLEKWLRVEAERFRNPVLRLFHTELEAVYEEKNRSLDSDDDIAWETLLAELFRNHTYGTQTTIGTVEHLKNPSMTKIREYYEKYYVPNNMAILLAGDLDYDRTIQWIAKHFGYMQPKRVEQYTYQPEVPRTSPSRREVWGPNPEYVAIAYRFPGVSNKDARILSLIDLLLVNQTAGLIDLNLNQKQKVLSASTWAMQFTDYSAHFFFGNPMEGQKLEDVEQLLKGEIEKVKRGEFDEKLMDAVINDLKIRQIRQFQENSGRLNALVDAYITHREWTDYLATIDELDQVTKKEIVDVANKYYGNDHAVVYKRTGERKDLVKVAKPEITPVNVNRDAVSPFVQEISGIEPEPVKPRFLEFEKDIQHLTLKSGIPVWYLKNTENDLFSLYYVLDMGKRHDKKLAFAVEYLSFLGTNKYTPEAFKKKLYELGCSFSVQSSDEQVYVYLSGLDKNFAEGVKLFEHLLANAKPDEKALASLVERTLKARSDAKKDKQKILFQALQKYGVHGRINPVTDILSEAELSSLTPAELVSKIKGLTGYQHTVYYYGPKPATATIALLNDVHKTPKQLAAIPNVPEYKFQDTRSNTVYFVDFPMQQAEVILLSKSFDYDPARVPVMQMFNEYFGGGMSSIVFQTIRESKALAYAVWSNFITPERAKQPNYVVAYVGTQADKLPETMAGMFELLNDMPKADPVFQQAKKAILNKIETERTLRENVLFAYKQALDLGLNYDIRKSVYEQVPQLEYSDIERFQQEYIKGKNYTILVLGAKDRVDMNTLAKYGEVKKLSLPDIFGY